MRFVFLQLLIWLISCNDKSEVNSQAKVKQNLWPFIKANSRSDLQEVRLNKSNYYLQLPPNFKLIEVEGKEGGLGYDIISKNNSSTMFGFIEIEKFNIIGVSPLDKTAKTFAESNLFNKTVKWTIHKTENGYYNADTQEKDLNATAFSKKRNEIDTLISIIATVKQK